MKGYEADSYGEAMADIYDAWYEIQGTEQTVERLKSLTASSGKVLELGSGTGRLAIPLAQSGLEVTVIESSQKMLDAMYEREGSKGIVSFQADMSRFSLPGETFDLIVCAYHTFFQLPSREAQLTCLKSVADHLAANGRVVLESFVDDSVHTASGIEVWRVEKDRVVLSASQKEEKDGAVKGQVIELSETGIKLRPWRVLYLSPDELDGLAAKAGLKLVSRWGDWDEAEFTARSRRQVAAYRLATR